MKLDYTIWRYRKIRDKNYDFERDRFAVTGTSQPLRYRAEVYVDECLIKVLDGVGYSGGSPRLIEEVFRRMIYILSFTGIHELIHICDPDILSEDVVDYGAKKVLEK